MKKHKTAVHRHIRLGITTLNAAAEFLLSLQEYIDETNDPSLLAMTKQQAEAILRYVSVSNESIELALRERVRISVLQGEYSQSQKKKFQERQAPLDTRPRAW